MIAPGVSENPSLTVFRYFLCDFSCFSIPLTASAANGACSRWSPCPRRNPQGTSTPTRLPASPCSPRSGTPQPFPHSGERTHLAFREVVVYRIVTVLPVSEQVVLEVVEVVQSMFHVVTSFRVLMGQLL